MIITYKKDVIKDTKPVNTTKDFKVGKVSFVVESSEGRHSDKTDTDYVLLKLSIMNEERQVAKITACLFFSDKMLWRFKSFCYCVGEEALFNSEKIDTDAFVGLEGNAMVDRNQQGYIEVKKFLLPIISIKTRINSTQTNNTKENYSEEKRKILDDEIPF